MIRCNFGIFLKRYITITYLMGKNIHTVFCIVIICFIILQTTIFVVPLTFRVKLFPLMIRLDVIFKETFAACATIAVDVFGRVGTILADQTNANKTKQNTTTT
ncbi:MAG: hypothetical protein J5597_08220 [Spirochaetaceae bacterium]|nr:hypothetical protein [Spirochaetaceae bacterium]